MDLIFFVDAKGAQTSHSVAFFFFRGGVVDEKGDKKFKACILWIQIVAVILIFLVSQACLLSNEVKRLMT